MEPAARARLVLAPLHHDELSERSRHAVHEELARDLDKLEPRTFRMDRISRPKLLSDVRFRPDMRVVEAQLPDTDCWRPLIGSA